MKIYLTFDYELYFGSKSGSLRKCILEPTQQLMAISKKHHVNFNFFVDCGYLLKLKEYALKYPKLLSEYKLIAEQLLLLLNDGNGLQLHIHPHWEDSTYDGEKWNMNTQRYKLADFSKEEIENIFDRYIKVLVEITGKNPVAYRAGGWCIQPFSKIAPSLRKHKIFIDSTVFPGGKNLEGNYSYDFSVAPNSSSWRFEDDPCVEMVNGSFKEYPISSIKNSPFFFWKLFLLGRINPNYYRPIGDGVAMPAPGYRKRLLTRYTLNPLSVDGYNASLLYKAYLNAKKNNKQELVVIGHPKALSPFSLTSIDRFIAKVKSESEISVF